jgi:hypothetical protein
MYSPYVREEAPGLEGPDYVTLVIEWDEDSEAVTLVSAQDALGSAARSTGRKVATVVGALAAIALATWGIRHLRAS